MARRIHLQPYLRVAELDRGYWTAKEPTEWTWWQILWLLDQGRTATELSAITSYQAYWNGQIANRYSTAEKVGRDVTGGSQRPSPRQCARPSCQEELRATLAEVTARGEPWLVRTW